MTSIFEQYVMTPDTINDIAALVVASG